MTPARARRVGLTGGIGSGKSTVAAFLTARGAVVIDADAISRSVTLPGGPALQPIREAFGGGVFGADLALNRAALRELVFADAAARQRLENIIHPLVSAETSAATLRAQAQGARCIVFDVPLLVESMRWRARLDHVVVVDCRESVQLERVRARSGWTDETTRAVMAGQASRSARLASADVCLFNDGISLEALEVLVDRAASRFGL
ncbi:MAG: dephospho-CoA kinase [Pseudomonadota bacterium]